MIPINEDPVASFLAIERRDKDISRANVTMENMEFVVYELVRCQMVSSGSANGV